MTSVAQHEPGASVAGTASDVGRKSRMEPFVNVTAFTVFALLWAAFAAALIWSQGSLDQTWQWIGSLPLIAQGVLWLLLLPIVAGLWVWETTWPFVVRLVVVGGLGFMNLYVFFPRTLFGSRL
jgi:hypothetical protein